MGKRHKPRKGSRAFWPKKRARKIYPGVKYPLPLEKEKVSPLAFAGYKAGMVQFSFIDTRKDSATSGKEKVQAATVLDCPPLMVCGMKLYRKGYRGIVSEGTVWHENLAKDLARKLDVPKKPHMKKVYWLWGRIAVPVSSAGKGSDLPIGSVKDLLEL